MQAGCNIKQWVVHISLLLLWNRYDMKFHIYSSITVYLIPYAIIKPCVAVGNKPCCGDYPHTESTRTRLHALDHMPQWTENSPMVIFWLSKTSRWPLSNMTLIMQLAILDIGTVIYVKYLCKIQEPWSCEYEKWSIITLMEANFSVSQICKYFM